MIGDTRPRHRRAPAYGHAVSDAKGRHPRGAVDRSRCRTCVVGRFARRSHTDPAGPTQPVKCCASSARTGSSRAARDDRSARSRTVAARPIGVGIMLDSGLIPASDSRTHAGVDNFAKFCKMTAPRTARRARARAAQLRQSCRHAGGDRRIAPARGGRRRQAQPVDVAFDVRNGDGRIGCDARYRHPRRARISPKGRASMHRSSSAGRSAARAPRLFGSMRKATSSRRQIETPYLQTGETKYGKPIIERVITRETALLDAAKVRAGVVRLDDAQQPVCRHAGRPHLLSARQPRSRACAAISTRATLTSPR